MLSRDFLLMNLRNARQRAEDGVCEGGHKLIGEGSVRVYRVKGDDLDWGFYSYCDTCRDSDHRAGFFIRKVLS